MAICRNGGLSLFFVWRGMVEWRLYQSDDFIEGETAEENGRSENFHKKEIEIRPSMQAAYYIHKIS